MINWEIISHHLDFGVFGKSGPVDSLGSLRGEQFLMSLSINAKLLGLGCGIGFVCQGLQSVPQEQSKREEGNQTSNSDTL